MSNVCISKSLFIVGMLFYFCWSNYCLIIIHLFFSSCDLYITFPGFICHFCFLFVLFYEFCFLSFVSSCMFIIIFLLDIQSLQYRPQLQSFSTSHQIYLCEKSYFTYICMYRYVKIHIL